MKTNKTEKIMEELEDAGFDHAIAVATESEINAGAACGQLAIIEEDMEWMKAKGWKNERN